MKHFQLSNWLVPLLAGCLILPPACFAGQHIDQPQALTVDPATFAVCEKAREALEKGDFETAAQDYKKAIEMCPGKAALYCNLMNCQLKTGDLSNALTNALEAETLDPDNPLYLRNLGNAYQVSGKLSEAIDTFKGFLKKFPKDGDAKRVKALIKDLTKAASQNQAAPSILGLQQGEFCKWRGTRMPLQVYIANADDVLNYQDAFGKALADAFKEWADASAGRISFNFVNRKSGSDIVCNFVSERTRAIAAEDGNTRTDADNNGMIESAKILLLTTTDTGQPMSVERVKEISLHEIGHALGITQHSRDPKDIMFYSVHAKEGLTALSEHDKSTIQQLYDRPDPMPKPASTSVPPINIFH